MQDYLKDLHDIAPPVVPWEFPWVATLLAAAGLALAILAWRILRPKPPTPSAPPPAETARQRLEALRARIDALDPYLLAIHTGDTLRDFFEAHFGLHAPRQTTPEFLRAARQSPRLRTDTHARLGEFLDRIDAAKFAHNLPHSEECRRLLDLAERIVNEGAAS